MHVVLQAFLFTVGDTFFWLNGLSHFLIGLEENGPCALATASALHLLGLWGLVSFILVPLKWTWGILDPRIQQSMPTSAHICVSDGSHGMLTDTPVHLMTTRSCQVEEMPSGKHSSLPFRGIEDARLRGTARLGAAVFVHLVGTVANLTASAWWRSQIHATTPIALGLTI